jgi:hypothetical protein
MDPDKALQDLRICVQDLAAGDDFYELVGLFQGLDKWLSDGGFLPKAWNRHRRATL